MANDVRIFGENLIAVGMIEVEVAVDQITNGLVSDRAN